MNVESILDAIELCQKTISAEAYQEYAQAMKDNRPHAALSASDFSGKVDLIFGELKALVQEYEESR